MKKYVYPVLALAILAGSAFTVFSSQDWKIAEKYGVTFDGGDPTGEFKGLKGDIRFDPNDLATSKFDVTVDVASINTGNGMMNTHAKSDKWFDAAKYPTIKFTSSSITKTSAGYLVAGTLDMHGIQKPVSIPFTFDNNDFKGSFEVNRMDFNINTAEPDHGGSKFKIALEVPVTK